MVTINRSIRNGGGLKWVKQGESSNYPDGIEDNPHFSENGAKEIAGLVVEGIRENHIQPLKKFEGTVIAIIHRKNDIEDKLVVSKYLHKYSKEQIKVLVEFQERFFDSEIAMS